MKIALSLAVMLALVGATSGHADEATDLAAVKSVVGLYKQSMEALDASRAKDLFTADSQVFESGGVEGTFAHYLEHHIGPELDEFKEFAFRDYKLEVRLDPPFAITTESYIYRIVLKADGKVVERQGVATSVLKKINGQWRFIQTHSSSRVLPRK
ncbi:MAG TPA: nuclear transport factor 2 family protein [Candidatus Didemnitutus sp.]|jgi:ketosteroid isomerase-like protein|nr:nuclear transport factor 2 family protein [Candidatus Didemnitutus sp.]